MEISLDLMQELYFYVLAVGVPVGDDYHRKKKDYFLKTIKSKIQERVPNFATQEWFERRGR
jgi:hypothetical protein